MGVITRPPEVVPRRDQALAFIIERIARTGTSPTFEEIGIRLDVSSTRAKELVAQLIERGLVEKTPGAQRSLRVRDVSGSRALLDETMRRLGWAVAQPMGALCQPPPFPEGQLPVIPPFEHLPDVD
ncbi:LexA family protein [Sphingomonas sp. CFBP 13733]|uniref:LexA family protein n=1 Tax=Sphingomonas sp. CFBP 13733 TaxID=2775291 RepID=UPI00177CCE65|nr:winged helix DNA-binding protein [Sphingomonas sp. CFBP 13733]MBD8641120.1 winged helix DNA-binding protein [Sphingomonas sp. CFBP 13733]